MDDDFGTGKALASLFDLARDINRLCDAGYNIAPAKQLFLELTGVLGLTLKPREGLSLESEPFIDLLISTRQHLREAKQFQLADEIRNKLNELGVTLEDTSKGATWRAKR